MVFIGGPRQVGKTTLSKKIAEQGFTQTQYFNWDVDEDRRAILKKQWRQDADLIIFDELHKYPKWKQWIKGVYDSRPAHQTYIVTGSARLDVYKRGGDSLLGRYHYTRLHPFTLDELPESIAPEQGLQRLMTLGGFPEPFLSNDERESRRWRRERFERILREDVREIQEIRSLQMLELFVDAMRHRAGQLITLSNIARDLEIAPKTAKNWLTLIEKMYIGFAIYPFKERVLRSINKPPKVYFYDNADVLGDEGARFENLVATTLLKRLQYMEDFEGYRCQLHYIRDKEGREVDFVTVKDGVVEELIEVKLSDSGISPALRYFTQHLKPKRAVQIVANLSRSYHDKGILVISPIEYFHAGYYKTEIKEF